MRRVWLRWRVWRMRQVRWLLFQNVWRLQENVWHELQDGVRGSMWSKDVRYWMQSGCVWNRSETASNVCDTAVFTRYDSSVLIGGTH